MLAPAIVSAQTPDFTLKGLLSNEQRAAKVYLSYRLDGKNVIDSTVLNKGAFQFKGVAAKPIKATLILDHQNEGLAKVFRSESADALDLYLEKGTITLNGQDLIEKANISGSPLNTEFSAYSKYFAVATAAMDAVNKDYAAAPAEKKESKEFQKELTARYQKASAEKKELQAKFIKEHPGSYFSLVALTEVAGSSIDVSKVEPLFKGLSADLQKSESGLAFAKQIEAARATSIGAMAPQFTQNDVNDKPVSLASFKGKYVLIDFWASWCGPCRAENPNVVDAYNQYKDKNFTVLGISLDNPGKKEAWLGAIEKDNLKWTQLSDLNGWNNAVAKQYGIRSIPQNLLIDPTGKIVGKNLRGEELHKKLKEIIGAGASK